MVLLAERDLAAQCACHGHGGHVCPHRPSTLGARNRIRRSRPDLFDGGASMHGAKLRSILWVGLARCSPRGPTIAPRFRSTAYMLAGRPATRAFYRSSTRSSASCFGSRPSSCCARPAKRSSIAMGSKKTSAPHAATRAAFAASRAPLAKCSATRGSATGTTPCVTPWALPPRLSPPFEARHKRHLAGL